MSSDQVSQPGALTDPRRRLSHHPGAPIPLKNFEGHTSSAKIIQLSAKCVNFR